MSNRRERKITFTVTEAYIQRVLSACAEVGAEGVGSLIHLNHAKGCEVTVYPGALRCSVYWEARNQKHREVLWYDSIPVCYELSDGILLRVNEYTVLFLPIIHDAHSNKSLLWMRKQLRRGCVETPTFAVLTGDGIGRLSRMKDKLRIRSKQRRLTPLSGFMIDIWLLPFVLAVGLVYGAWHGGPVPYEEAIPYTGAFQSYYTTRGRNSHTYLDLEGQVPFLVQIPRDAESLEVLQPGTEVHVMRHPRTGEVMEIVVGDEVLASFDAAYTHLNRVSSACALLSCVCVGAGIYLLRPVFFAIRSKEGYEKRAAYDRNLQYERERGRGKTYSKRRKR